jgi:hypothetical protein
MNPVWILARLAVRVFYRVERIGPPVPGGALLLVANHPNVLLDPERVVALCGAARGLPPAAADRLERRRRIAAGIEQLRARDPARYEGLRAILRAYEARLARFGLRDVDVKGDVPRRAALRFAVREAVLALGLLVYALWVALLAGAAGAAGGWPLALLALVALPVVATTALFAIERETAVAEALRAWLATRRASRVARGRLARRQAEIADLLRAAYEWLEQDRRAPGREAGPAG